MRNPAILAELEKRQRVREDTALEILRNAQPQVAMRLTRIALAEETETPQVINAAKEILKDVLISRAETISRAEVLIKDQDAVLAESKAIIAELERRAALELPSSNPSPQQVVVGSENNGQSSANIDRQPQPS